MKKEFILQNNLSDEIKQFIIDSIERSYNLNSIDILNNKLKISFKDEVNDDDFKEVLNKMLFISKNINKDLIFKNEINHSYNENPMDYLIESNNVVKIMNGIYLYQHDFLKIFNYFNDYFKKLAEKYNAIEQEYPPIWPVDLYKKINYFKEFPQQVILAAKIKKNNKNISEFSEKYDNNNDFDKVEIDDNLDSIDYGLHSSVCDNCYYILRNRDDIANTVITVYNKVFRNEYSKINSLDRLTGFSVRDIVFIGSEEFVLEIRQKLIDDVIDFLKYLNIDCKLETASDPFFTNDSIIKNVFQYTSKLKYELLAKLNFSSVYSAIGSINFHLDYFGKSFNIKMKDGKHMYSGCLGIGFERLVYALYCQYGPDLNKWPVNLKKDINL